MTRWGCLPWIAGAVLAYGALAWFLFERTDRYGEGVGTRALIVSLGALSLGALIAGIRALSVSWDDEARSVGCAAGIISFIVIVAGWAALAAWGPG